MNSYISAQFQRIGLYIKNNKPVNEYPDYVRLKLDHVNGQTNWLSLSDKQLKAIYKILSAE
jgi:hypothetical protein